MLSHVLGLDVNGHPRVLDSALERHFEPADVMCVSEESKDLRAVDGLVIGSTKA
jgi:hypothetical protein